MYIYRVNTHLGSVERYESKNIDVLDFEFLLGVEIYHSLKSVWNALNGYQRKEWGSVKKLSQWLNNN